MPCCTKLCFKSAACACNTKAKTNQLREVTYCIFISFLSRLPAIMKIQEIIPNPRGSPTHALIQTPDLLNFKKRCYSAFKLYPGKCAIVTAFQWNIQVKVAIQVLHVCSVGGSTLALKGPSLCYNCTLVNVVTGANLEVFRKHEETPSRPVPM